LPPPAEAVSERPANGRSLPAAAVRALAEAAARRAQGENSKAEKSQTPNEIGGRDPTRYGDWEINGLASDF